MSPDPVLPADGVRPMPKPKTPDPALPSEGGRLPSDPPSWRQRLMGEKLEHLRVARLEPGDRLIVTYPEVLTQEDADRIVARMERAFPGVVCIVMGGGMELGIVRRSDGSD